MYAALTLNKTKDPATGSSQAGHPIWNAQDWVGASGTILTMIACLLLTPFLHFWFPEDVFMPVAMLAVANIAVANGIFARIPIYICEKYINELDDKIREQKTSYDDLRSLRRGYKQAAMSLFPFPKQLLVLVSHFGGILTVSAVAAIIAMRDYATSGDLSGKHIAILAVPAVWILMSNCALGYKLYSVCDQSSRQAQTELASR